MAIVNYDGTITHEGVVLAKTERNYYDDSDFIAVVWNAREARVEEVMYNTTRAAGGGTATVDADPVTIALAKEHLIQRNMNIMREVEAKEAQNPNVIGREVIISRGRKSKGKRGTVVRNWEQRSQYGTWSYGWRLLVRTNDGEVWLDADKCDVADPWEFISTPQELRQRAEASASTITSLYNFNRGDVERLLLR